MTSEQVRLIVTRVLLFAVAVVSLAGCQRRPSDPQLEAPYLERQVWAVAPLRNETGTRHADGFRVADQLARVFERVEGINTLPVNRVIEAMSALKMTQVRSREDAIHLREALGVDALIVGTMTHYDAYEPLKFGLALDLYAWAVDSTGRPLDIRGLSWAPTADKAGIRRATLYRPDQPVTSVSGFFDAGGVGTKQLISRHAYGKGTTPNALHNERLYTIDMDLFQEFVSQEMGSQMIWAEWKRVARGIRERQRQAAAQEPAKP